MVDPQLLRSLKEENIDLKHEIESLRDQNSRLWKVIRALNELQSDPRAIKSPPDLLEMVMNILRLALAAVESENGSILLLDEESDELVFIAVVGERSKELTNFRIPAGSGIAGWVNLHKKAALVSDVRKDDRWISAVDQSIGFHTQSLMAVPLMLEDRVLGVIEVVNSRSENLFTDKDLDLLQLVARLASYVFGSAEDEPEITQNHISGENLN
jgi:GAF domain-containing protein